MPGQSNTPITCVHVVSTVEFMVAAGTADGRLNVFQIQKRLPDDLPLAACPLTRRRPVERFVVADMHAGGAVRALRWSKNGMRLFSGDRRGSVVLTEFDYQLVRADELRNYAEIIVNHIRRRNFWCSTSASPPKS